MADRGNYADGKIQCRHLVDDASQLAEISEQVSIRSTSVVKSTVLRLRADEQHVFKNDAVCTGHERLSLHFRSWLP